MIKEIKTVYKKFVTSLNAWTQSQEDLDIAKRALNVAVSLVLRHDALSKGDKGAEQFAVELKIKSDVARIAYDKALDCEKRKQKILTERKRKLDSLILSDNNKED